MENNSSARMGSMPMNKLVLKISLPIMFSMLIQALYNVVDSIFVARIDVGNDALTAVSLAFPIQMLMVAIGVGTGVGINSLISRRLGEGRPEEARSTAINGVFLAVISWVVFALFGTFFARSLFHTMTDNPAIQKMGADYLQICTIFSFGLFLQLAFEKIMQGSGNTFYNMIVQGTGAVINILFDPILIFGFGPIPAMGVAGAAWATVGGQIVAMILGITLNQLKNKELKLHIKGFRPHWPTIKGIYIVGFPSIIMQSIGSIMTFLLNKILVGFSETAVAVLGIYFKLQSFVFMPVFGLTNGLVAIVGYNFGAHQKQRIYHAIKIGLLYAVIIMLLGTLVFMAAPEWLLGLFDASPEMLEIGIPALQIISSSFFMAAISIILSTVFQAMGNGVLSLIMSITRQLVVLLPASYLLANLVGLHAVWWSFPLSECISLLLCLGMYVWVNKKYISPIEAVALEA